MNRHLRPWACRYTAYIDKICKGVPYDDAVAATVQTTQGYIYIVAMEDVKSEVTNPMWRIGLTKHENIWKRINM